MIFDRILVPVESMKDHPSSKTLRLGLAVIHVCCIHTTFGSVSLTRRRKLSWHHHQPATGVLKTRQANI